MDNTQLLFFILIIIPSAILHEYAHGLAADRLGDPTPKLMGRLSINPLVHIDPMGTILLPLFLFLMTGGSFLFAYAKPMPFNPLALRLRRWGPGIVGFAGPAANLLVALVFGLLVQSLPFSTFTLLLSVIVYANVLLAVFNLVPIPPLDGSKVLFSILPDRFYNFKVQLERYGLILLVVFLFVFSQLMSPVIWGLFRFFTGNFLP